MNGRASEYRAHRRRTRLTVIESLILCAAVLALAALAVRSGTGRQATRQTTTIRVEDSDTLWSIAEEHPLEGAGTARTVGAIRELNSMDDSDILAGQVLTVPDATGADSVAMR